MNRNEEENIIRLDLDFELQSLVLLIWLFFLSLDDHFAQKIKYSSSIVIKEEIYSCLKEKSIYIGNMKNEKRKKDRKRKKQTNKQTNLYERTRGFVEMYF